MHPVGIKSSFGPCFYVLLLSIVEADWPQEDVLAAAATRVFHNNVIGNQMNCDKMRPSVSLVSVSQPTIQRNQNDRSQLPPSRESQPTNLQVVQQPTEARAQPKPSFSTGKHTPRFPSKPPTPSQLYKEIPQSRHLTYKSEATGATTLFVMLRRG